VVARRPVGATSAQQQIGSGIQIFHSYGKQRIMMN